MPVNSGDPLKFPASLFNRMEAMVNSGELGAAESRAAAIELPLLAVKAVNGSETTDLDIYTPCELKQMELDPETVLPARTRPILEIVPATWYASLGSLAITLEPIAKGKSGLVAISGLCTAKVDVVSVDHRFATLHPTTVTQLRSCDAGDFRLVKPGGTGVRLCQVIAGQVEHFWRCALTADWNMSGTAAKLTTMGGVDFHASGSITLLDPDALLDDLLSGDIAFATQRGNEFYAVTAPCES